MDDTGPAAGNALWHETMKFGRTIPAFGAGERVVMRRYGRSNGAVTVGTYCAMPRFGERGSAFAVLSGSFQLERGQKQWRPKSSV